MGIIYSVFNEGFPPKSGFTVEDIPDLSGKVVIVTGGNSGIGLETAKALLSHGAKVYIACRSEEKAVQAIQGLKEETGQEALFLKLDLGDLASVQACAKDFLEKEQELHILFNNAGVMCPPVADVTVQGYDLQFGTNVLGHFYLTKLLLPVLTSTAKNAPTHKVRVVNVASSTHMFTSGVDFNTLRDSPARRKRDTHMLYCQSKLGNILFARQLAERFGEQGIVSTSLNPGNLRTNLERHLGTFENAVLGLILHPQALGALTQLYAGTSPEGDDLNGKYLIPWARIGHGTTASQDTKLAKELWDWLEEQASEFEKRQNNDTSLPASNTS